MIMLSLINNCDTALTEGKASHVYSHKHALLGYASGMSIWSITSVILTPAPSKIVIFQCNWSLLGTNEKSTLKKS